MKFYGGVRGGKRNKQLNFDGDPNHVPALVGICAHFTLHNELIIVACPDQGAGNDPEALDFDVMVFIILIL